jgi:hypothetical protein
MGKIEDGYFYFGDEKNTVMKIENQKATIEREEFSIILSWNPSHPHLPEWGYASVAKVTRKGIGMKYTVKYIIWKAETSENETSENWKEKTQKKLKALKNLLYCQSAKELQENIEDRTIQEKLLLETINTLFQACNEQKKRNKTVLGIIKKLSLFFYFPCIYKNIGYTISRDNYFLKIKSPPVSLCKSGESLRARKEKKLCVSYYLPR